MDPRNTPPNGNPSQQPGTMPPPGGYRPLTDEALNKKFSFSFTRAEILAIRGPILRFWKEFGLGDVKVFISVLDKLEPALSLTEDDYEKPEVPHGPQQNEAPKDKATLN